MAMQAIRRMFPPFAESSSYRFGRGEQAARHERAESVVGLAYAFGEGRGSVVAEKGAQRLVGQVHGKSERLSRGGDRRRGCDLFEYPQALLDRSVDTVHVE